MNKQYGGGPKNVVQVTRPYSAVGVVWAQDYINYDINNQHCSYLFVNFSHISCIKFEWKCALLGDIYVMTETCHIISWSFMSQLNRGIPRLNECQFPNRPRPIMLE